MIYFGELNQLNESDKYKFIKWKSDVELCDLIMSVPVNLSLEQLESWILKNTNDSNQYFKSVHGFSDNKLIGLARLMYIDSVSRIAEVGLYVGDIEDRKGRNGSEILNHLIKIANKQYKLNKVYAKIQEDNLGSIKLFEKAGFVLEGRLRDHYFSNLTNEFISVLVFSKFIK